MGCPALEQAPQGSAEFSSLVGFHRCENVALGDMTDLGVLGEQLDLMILEHFSNLNDSMIY